MRAWRQEDGYPFPDPSPSPAPRLCSNAEAQAEAGLQGPGPVGESVGQTASSFSAGVRLQNQLLCQEMELGEGRRKLDPGQKDRIMWLVGLVGYFF